jgi:hypothetical protein
MKEFSILKNHFNAYLKKIRTEEDCDDDMKIVPSTPNISAKFIISPSNL